jgi:hypothetical protein
MFKIVQTVLRPFVQPLKRVVEKLLTCKCRVESIIKGAIILPYHHSQYNHVHQNISHYKGLITESDFNCGIIIPAYILY